MVARTVGRETAALDIGDEDGSDVEWEGLEEGTKRSVDQVLKFRGEKGKKAFEEKARHFAVSLTESSCQGSWTHFCRTCCMPRAGRCRDIED